MRDHLTDLLRRQAVRDPKSIPGLRRELANLQEALASLVEDGRLDDASSFAVGLAVVAAEDPAPGLTEQLGMLAPERVVTETDALLALAAGHAKELSSQYAEAKRLVTAALDTMPDDHPLRWAASCCCWRTRCSPAASTTCIAMRGCSAPTRRPRRGRRCAAPAARRSSTTTTATRTRGAGWTSTAS